MLSGTVPMYRFFQEVMQKPQFPDKANLPAPSDVINTYATTNAGDAVEWARVLEEYKQQWRSYVIDALTVHVQTPTLMKIMLPVAQDLRYPNWKYENESLHASQQLGHLARVVAAEAFNRLRQKMAPEMERDSDHVLMDLVRHHKAVDVSHTEHQQGDHQQGDAHELWVRGCRSTRPAFVVRKVPHRQQHDAADERAKDTMASADLLYSYTAMGLPGQHSMQNTILCPGFHS